MKPLCKALMLAAALFTVTHGVAAAQTISVNVDGSPVTFSGTRPQTVQGRVLVPLRGVFEKLGAYVDWVPATQTVVAQKGDTYIELRIGSPSATVNGRQAVLDVPAALLGGRTMVPLRFLGEALGATVVWDGATRTVNINTGAPGTPSPTPTPGPSTGVSPTISSFNTSASGWLRAGQELQVTMMGTQGGSVSFQIPGVVQNVAMQEASPGRYVGRWQVPSGGQINIEGASVIGVMRMGGQERLIQAGQNISIDTTAPRITDLTPEPDTRAASDQPSISAVFDDAGGSGIDTSKVSITVNGQNRTSAATITPVFVNYRPNQELAAGEVTVRVTAADRAGNQMAQDWKFTVPDVKNVITSFTSTPLSDIQPGDVVTVTMEAQQGGNATFSIGRVVQNRAMAETQPGTYTGEYTMRRTDDLSGAIVTGTFRAPDGQTYTVQSGERVTVSPGVLDAPVITAPAEGGNVSSPLVVRGTAAPDSRVSLRVEYSTSVLGAVRVGGTLSSQTVEVNANGQWQSANINLDTLISGRDTTYTITATTLNQAGEESSPTVITVSRG